VLAVIATRNTDPARKRAACGVTSGLVRLNANCTRSTQAFARHTVAVCNRFFSLVDSSTIDPRYSMSAAWQQAAHFL
jgi:hypothetical protein